MNFTYTYTDAFPDLAAPAVPDIPTGTTVAWVNEPLAAELGLDPAWLASDEGLAWLTGDSSETFALAYSGYQFGQLSPVLGDGRAHLLGEVVGSKGRVDLHLKGSGRTAFSRPGSDGKAPLSAVWREVIIGETLHALGLPTTRALAVLTTGERIQRHSPLPEPAGILVRAAASHLRVGTFQYAHMNCSEQVRSDLVRYALERHYPGVEPGDAPALTLLREVTKKQAELVASWTGLGFVHGVLNTDNVAISGESIDFGPCAFIDEFKRGAVYSSIDRQGRYAFANQPGVTFWNLSRFAESLLDLIDADDPNKAVHWATSVLEGFEELYLDACARVFAAKLGIDLGEKPAGEDLDEVSDFVEKTFDLLETESIDLTVFFRTLVDAPEKLASLARAPQPVESWTAALTELREGRFAPELMETANPVYIPRNLTLDAALDEVNRGNTEPIQELLTAVREPFARRPGLEHLEAPAENSRFFTSYCGT